MSSRASAAERAVIAVTAVSTHWVSDLQRASVPLNGGLNWTRGSKPFCDPDNTTALSRALSARLPAPPRPSTQRTGDNANSP